MGAAPPSGVMLMPELASAAMLRPNEKAVQVWRAGLEQDHYDPEEGEHGTFNLNGVLIATDQRLIFVQEKGLFDKSYRALESIEYREIANWKLGQTIRVRSLRVDVAQEMVHLIDQLTQLYAGQDNIGVSAIPATPGTVHIETPSGMVDASLRTQLSNLREYFDTNLTENV